MYFVLYRDVANQWRWTLYASNHRKIADSAEGYWNKSDALGGINLVKRTNTATQVYER
jgi:uncharacterized protein YegP (UPF0339 family)